MNIRKLLFNGQAFYPATILNAIKDVTNGKTLVELLQELRDAILTKVDKVTGKSLLSDTEIAKLSNYPTLGSDTDKWLRADGSLTSIAVGSGGHAANVYLTNAASDVSGYKKLSYDPDLTQAEITGTSTNNVAALMASYIYDLPIAITDIDAGIWRFTALARVSNTQGNTRLRVSVFKRSTTNVETVLTQFESDPINSITNVKLLFEANTALLSVSATDRIGVKLYAITDSATSKTVTAVIGGANSAYLNTPVAMRHNQLRAVNEDANVQHMTAAQKTAVDSLAAGNYQLKSEKNQANGYAGLDNNGLLDPTLTAFKKYIGLERQGDGTGLTQFIIRSNRTGTAKIYGGNFYSEISGVNIVGSQIQLVANADTFVNVKLTSAMAQLEVDNLVYFKWNILPSTINSPYPNANVSEFPREIEIALNLNTKIYGNTSYIPRDVKLLRVTSPVSGVDYFGGNYRDLPRGIINLSLNGTKVIGDFKDLPRKIDSLSLLNTTSSTIGLIKDLPIIKRLQINGGGSINGNLGDMEGAPSLIILDTTPSNNNITYLGGLVVDSVLDSIRIRPAVGVFTSNMTDQLFIDLAAQITTATASKVIDLSGNCGAPTAASASARAYLAGLGFAITTN